MKANVNFIQSETGDFEKKRCSICGKPALCTSQIILQGGYGSKFDLQTLKFEVCAECFDSFVESFLDERQEAIKEAEIEEQEE